MARHMKFGGITLGLWGLTMALMAGIAVAQTASDNWAVDGLNGGIRATGTLLASPCVLMPESVEQEVALGSAALWALQRPGSVTVPVPVRIQLDGCPGEVALIRNTSIRRGDHWVAGQSGVRMTVYGEAEPTDSRFFRVHGDIAGVALRLEDVQGDTLRPGMNGRVQFLNPGRNELALQAQLWRTAAPLAAGEWHAVVNVGLEYE